MATRMMTLPINENFTDDDVRDIATGIAKVVRALANTTATA
jgi:hypothetical protein